MATAAADSPATDSPTARRLRAGLPWLAFAVWAAGAYAIWSFGRAYQWSPSAQVLLGLAWVGVLGVAAHTQIRNMFGPVFLYEVVRLGRRRLTFILRLVYVGIIMAMLVLMYLSWLDDVGYFDYGAPDRVPYERLSGFANEFFIAFMCVQFGVVTFLTPAFVAGTVADEKERKTLEFLLATDLGSQEIIFGKLAARVTHILMFVLAGLPVLAFLQLFGGIDPDQLVAGTAATVITVVGLAALSVFFSTNLRRPRDAIALTYMAAAVYFVGSFLLGVYVRSLVLFIGRSGPDPLPFGLDTLDVVTAVQEVTDWFGAGNIGFMLLTMTAPPPIGAGGMSADTISTALFRYVVFWAAASGLLLGYSVWGLRPIALAQGPGGSAPKQARVSARMAKARPPVGDDPMFWKEVFVEGGVRGGCLGWFVSLAVIGLVFLVPVLIVYNVLIDPPGYGYNQTFQDRWEDFQEGMNVWCRIATGVLGLLVMLAAAIRGAGCVSGERDRDTWISLISTPLTAWEMLRGKWLGCVLGLRRAYTVMALVWGTALLVGAVDPPMILACVLYTAVYVSAFSWLGILCSITARTSLIATIRALMATLFLAGGFWLVILLCCAMPLSIVYRGPQGRWMEDVAQVLLGWTPPFVLGWMPLMDYERRDMGPFALSQYDGNMDGLGPFSPVLGLFVWLGLNALFGTLAWQAFQRITNRARDRLAATLPRTRRPRRPDPDDWPRLVKRKPPVAKRLPPKDDDRGEQPIVLD